MLRQVMGEFTQNIQFQGKSYQATDFRFQFEEPQPGHRYLIIAFDRTNLTDIEIDDKEKAALCLTFRIIGERHVMRHIQGIAGIGMRKISFMAHKPLNELQKEFNALYRFVEGYEPKNDRIITDDSLGNAAVETASDRPKYYDSST